MPQPTETGARPTNRERREVTLPPFPTYETIKDLPIKKAEDSIKSLVSESSQVIIVGQTGSGKSIVLPEIVLGVISDYGRDTSAKMLVTQPRQVAVDNAARALERLGRENIGIRYKGYKGDQHISEKTSVDVMVAGSLLNMLQAGLKDGTLLKEYKAVIIDEVHEESIDSHLNLILLKKVQALRKEKGMPELKIILTSGSVDVPKLKRSFPDAQDIEVEGRAYPVTDHFSDKEIAYEDMPIEAARKALDIIADPEKKGNILAIMPGRSDIAATIREFQAQLEARTDIQNKEEIEVIPISGGESDRIQQQKALEVSSKRRFFVGTPVVEASVTIQDLQHVIDSGLKKENVYDSKTGLSSLQLVAHTEANWKQRKGRAGRVAPGHGWYLFTKAQLDAREKFPKPEILSADLAAFVLKMKQIGIEDIYDSEYYIDYPGKERLNLAVATLQRLGALNGDGARTTTGEEMAEIPVDPHYARMLVEAKKRHCTNAVSVLIGFLSNQKSVFDFNPRIARFTQKYGQFIVKDSDYLTLLNVWNGYIKNRHRAKEWSIENGFNLGVLREVERAKNDFIDDEEAKELGIEERGVVFDMENQALLTEIQKSVVSGFVDRLLARTNKGDYAMRYGFVRGIRIGSRSSLQGESPQFIVADSIAMRGSKDSPITIAETCQKVEEDWVEELLPKLENKTMDNINKEASEKNKQKAVAQSEQIINESKHGVSPEVTGYQEVQKEARQKKGIWSQITGFFRSLFGGSN